MTTQTMTPALRDHLLAFADDEHLMGQHHTEWIGVAPFLEEDLALSSIGQDELGHAVMLYELVLTMDGVDPTDAAIDELAFRRSAEDYRSCQLVEYPAEDWAETLVRHWIYDMIEEVRWDLVAGSSLPALAEISVRAGREEVYHRRHADALLAGLLASSTGQDRIRAALELIIPLVPSILEPTVGESELVAQGVIAAPLASRSSAIAEAIGQRFGIDPPTFDGFDSAVSDGGRTQRTEYFAPLMARMLEVLDLDPQATW